MDDYDFDFGSGDDFDISSFFGDGGSSDVDVSNFDFGSGDDFDVSSLLSGDGGLSDLDVSNFDFGGGDDFDISSLLGEDSGVSNLDASNFDFGSGDDFDISSLLDGSLNIEELLKTEGGTEALSRSLASLASDDRDTSGGTGLKATGRGQLSMFDPETGATGITGEGFTSLKDLLGSGTEEEIARYTPGTADYDLRSGLETEGGQGFNADSTRGMSLEQMGGGQGLSKYIPAEYSESALTQLVKNNPGAFPEIEEYLDSQYDKAGLTPFKGTGGTLSETGFLAQSSAANPLGSKYAIGDPKSFINNPTITGQQSVVSPGRTIIDNKDGTYKVVTNTVDGTKTITTDKAGVDKIIRETKTIDNTKTINNTKTVGGGGGGKQAGKSDNNMLLMLLALMAMMNKGGGDSKGTGAVIPSLSADRKQLPYGPTSGSKARPGAGGVNYFSPTTYTQKAAGGGLMSLAEGGDVQRFAIGNLVKADIDKAYAAGDYGKVNELAQANKITAADVASTYQGFDASGLAGKGINLYQPPVANVQELPVTPNNNASNTSFQKVGLGTFRGRPIINPADTETEINNYFTKNQNLVKNKDYNTIASDMYTSGWTPEMVAQSTGTDVKNVSDLYNQTYGAFDRATQENLVKQKYKKQFGLTDAQLGEIGFGANLFSKEDQPKNIRLNNAYGRYQDELAAAGRYDAPADAYYRTKAIFKPEGKVKPDGTSRRSGRIELVDAVTGKPVTSFGAGQKSGQIFELLDKYGVDPASFKNAFKGAVNLPNNSGYRKDDYDRLMGYKAKNLSGKTDDYLTKPLKNITRADLKHKYEQGNEDSKTNVFYLGEMKKQLRDKGLSNRESSDILSQFRNVSGLVNWAEIIKSKDPLKAVTGTLNTLQSKGLINRRFAEGGISSLAAASQMSDLGGYSDGGRLLRGPGDGVSDSIPATIGGKQPARLAEGEFVVPARIVSELGNGSTNAGAQKLYAMMDRVQKARRKTKNVAADTKAHKYLPA